MTPDKLRKNIEALITEGEQVLATKVSHMVDSFRSRDYVDSEKSAQWATNTIALLRSAFGQDSEHYGSAGRFVSNVLLYDSARQLLGVLRAALVAWDNGYVFTLRQLVAAEVESDLIDQADALLQAGYHRAAAVLAGAVLEQHLRALCRKHGIDELNQQGKPKTLEPLNGDLYSADVYDATRKKQITYLGGMRNDAAHGGNYSATVDDVKRMLRDVNDLCATVK